MTTPPETIAELRAQLEHPPGTGMMRGIEHVILNRLEAAEATIADTRAELVKHFDDIDVDYEGEPNDLDTMVRQAAGQLKNARSHGESETERANVAEHKNSQLRSRFALELAARTTPDMAELQRQANRITEFEESARDERFMIETLANALRVDHAAHCITELVHAAADEIKRLRKANAVERRWQEVDRPKLTARIAELKAAQLQPLPLTHPELEPGMSTLVVFEGSCPLGSDTTEDWCIGKHDKAVGWLPLPDQSEANGD